MIDCVVNKKIKAASRKELKDKKVCSLFLDAIDLFVLIS